MSPGTVRLWSRIHTWTSLVCTLFLLLLCLTGLPLIFHEEIEHLTGEAVEPPPLPAETPRADLDRIVGAGMAQRPGEVVQYVIWARDEPDAVWLSMAPSRTAPPEALNGVILDARTGAVLQAPEPGLTFMRLMFRLHVDLFAGLPGKLFLGAMGLLFVLTIVSGIVLYGPFMRRLEFGTVRRGRSARLRWLDLHNLIGVATLTWALVVGFTGVVNTWADLVFAAWRQGDLAEMVRPYAGLPPIESPGSVEQAVTAARTALPGRIPYFVAYPQTPFSSAHHYAVFMRGEAPLTSRLLTPVLVDAATGAVTAVRPLPWYATALLLSQPLHFGDYGGLPMKALWALLDLATIIVLGSGLWLWIARRRQGVAPARIEAAPLPRRAE